MKKISWWRIVVIGLLPLGPVHAQVLKAVPASPPVAMMAGPAASAYEAYRQARRADAVELARPLAEQGNADALYLLGFSLESPEAPKASRATAIDYYYRLAANAGHREAGFRRLLIELDQPDGEASAKVRARLEEAAKTGAPAAGRILGEAWLRGLMTGKPDFDQAEQSWRAAAEGGDTAAFILLARLHEGEFGFPDRQDPAKALEEYRKAAVANDTEAFVPLASRLLNGRQDLRNEGEAGEWLAKAMAKNNGAAWLLAGDQDEKVKKDVKAALDHYRSGASHGDADCMMRLAKYELTRKDGNAQEGRAWLEKAVKAGSPDAMAEIGIWFLKSDSPDIPAAYRYLLPAANNGVSAAQYELGMLYLKGRLGAADPASSVTWFTEAMKAGHTEAQYQLGLLNEKGIGTPVNYANAGVLYTLACGKGHAGAAARIARMAVEGLGTKRNLPQAWAHATLALERGDSSVLQLQADVASQLDTAQKTEADAALAKLKDPKVKAAQAGAPRQVQKVREQP